MSKFFNDGIITSFPQSLDAAGQFPRIQINEINEPGDEYTQVMRADEIGGILGDAIRQNNLVRYCIDVVNDAAPLGTATISTISKTNIIELPKFIRDSLNPAINERLTDICSELEINLVQFIITHADIIGTDVKPVFDADNAQVYGYRTYDVIIYGQFTPNPAAEPAPAPCENLTGYEFRVAYNVADPTKGRLYIYLFGIIRERRRNGPEFQYGKRYRLYNTSKRCNRRVLFNTYRIRRFVTRHTNTNKSKTTKPRPWIYLFERYRRHNLRISATNRGRW
jgi:hypothetical protein